MGWLGQVDRRVVIAVALSTTIAVLVALGFWTFSPGFGIVFSNVSTKDGGAIIAALEQMNVPYKTSEGGSAILVAADQVHQVRLKLAALGLPKGANASFDLLDNQKFGVSQFVEQTNYQRALTGELEKSLQTISSVESAKVLLGIPKHSAFIREQKKTTASVVLTLYPGRSLTEPQVRAVLHLVSTSVPELTVENIAIVDQRGNLLSNPVKADGFQVDGQHLKYTKDVQDNIVSRIESLLGPIVGLKNIRATAAAEIDLITSVQSEETYKPNKEGVAAIRNQQTNESSVPSSAVQNGIPGAVSNMPGSVNAPIVNAPQSQPSVQSAVTDPTVLQNQQTNKSETVSFEIDKTLRHSQKAPGAIRKLSVAVVLNHKSVDISGTMSQEPWTEEELKQITALVRDAMGFSSVREDSVSVVNMPFVVGAVDAVDDPPFWKNAELMDLLRTSGKFVLFLVVFFAAYRMILKSISNVIRTEQPKKLGKVSDEREPGAGSRTSKISAEMKERLENLENAQVDFSGVRRIAKDNPKLVANVVSSWLRRDG